MVQVNADYLQVVGAKQIVTFAKAVFPSKLKSLLLLSWYANASPKSAVYQSTEEGAC